MVLLGPPGTGKTHLAIGLGIKAALGGHRVSFATATEWVRRLGVAHRSGKLDDELAKLRRSAVLIIDEVGYLPFEAEAANLFFQLVSSRYEQGSIIVTSNRAFGQWGDIFGDATVAAAMRRPTDRQRTTRQIAHKSQRRQLFRMRLISSETLGPRCPRPTQSDHFTREGVNFQRVDEIVEFSTVADTHPSKTIRAEWQTVRHKTAYITATTSSYVAQYVGGTSGDCTATAWNGCTTAIDNTSASFVSLAIGPDGVAWLSYRNNSSGVIEVAQDNGLSGSGGTSPPRFASHPIRARHLPLAPGNTRRGWRKAPDGTPWFSTIRRSVVCGVTLVVGDDQLIASGYVHAKTTEADCTDRPVQGNLCAGITHEDVQHVLASGFRGVEPFRQLIGPRSNG